MAQLPNNAGGRYYPKPYRDINPNHFHDALTQDMSLLYGGVYDAQDALQYLAAQPQLVATVSGGAVTAVDVVKAGSGYTNVPSVSGVGGGGTGAKFSVTLDRDGGILSVSVTAGGSGYTSPPALTVTAST